ncbi:unnamed protein product [Gordionus sp. m RMFG-2023]
MNEKLTLTHTQYVPKFPKLSGKLSETYLNLIETYFEGHIESDSSKVRTLLCSLPIEIVDQVTSICSKAQLKDFNIVFGKLKLIIPSEDMNVNIKNFNLAVQGADESFHTFYFRISKLHKKCDFDNDTRMIEKLITCSLNDNIRRKLNKHKHEGLDKMMKLGVELDGSNIKPEISDTNYLYYNFPMSSLRHCDVMSSLRHVIATSCHRYVMSSLRHVIITSCHCDVMSSLRHVIITSCHRCSYQILKSEEITSPVLPIFNDCTGGILTHQITSHVLTSINDCTGGVLSFINKRKRWQINQKKKRTRDSEALQNLLTTQNKNTSILASDNGPTISRELNLILTPLQITSPVLPIFNDCTGGILTPHQITIHVLTSVNDCIPTISREITSPVLPIFNDCTGDILTPHQITSHVLTSVNDCTGGDLSFINKRKRWQINQKKKRTRDSEALLNLLTTQNKITSPVLPSFKDCTGGILTPHQNTSILASDNVPTISRELNLILTPLQITSPVLPSFNDCSGGILTPHQITSHVLTPVNDCTGGDLSVINKRKRWLINQKKKRTRDSEALQNLLTTQNKNTSILASDNVPTISRELNLILTPLQITSPVLPSFNDCTGGILTPHQITSHVLTSVIDCTGGDLSIINERKRWQINQKKKRTRDSEALQNLLTTQNKNTSILASDNVPT